MIQIVSAVHTVVVKHTRAPTLAAHEARSMTRACTHINARRDLYVETTTDAAQSSGALVRG